jgi:hypothetical protein
MLIICQIDGLALDATALGLDDSEIVVILVSCSRRDFAFALHADLLLFDANSLFLQLKLARIHENVEQKKHLLAVVLRAHVIPLMSTLQ